MIKQARRTRRRAAAKGKPAIARRRTGKKEAALAGRPKSREETPKKGSDIANPGHDRAAITYVALHKIIREQAAAALCRTDDRQCLGGRAVGQTDYMGSGAPIG